MLCSLVREHKKICSTNFDRDQEESNDAYFNLYNGFLLVFVLILKF